MIVSSCSAPLKKSPFQQKCSDVAFAKARQFEKNTPKSRLTVNILNEKLTSEYNKCINASSITNSSENKIETTLNVDPLKKIKNKCFDLKKDKWQEEVIRHECIQDIITESESQLIQGNSAEALRVSKVGMEHYGFHGGIKESYKKAQKVYVSATKLLAKSENVNCAEINERVGFLKSISPDIDMKISKCKKSLTKVKKHVDIFKLVTPKENKEFTHKAYKTISSMILYQVNKNNQDNFNSLIIKGVKFWEGLNFYSTAISFPPNTQAKGGRVDLEVKAKTSFVEDMDSKYCSDIQKNYAFSNGTGLECPYFEYGRKWGKTGLT